MKIGRPPAEFCLTRAASVPAAQEFTKNFEVKISEKRNNFNEKIRIGLGCFERFRCRSNLREKEKKNCKRLY